VRKGASGASDAKRIRPAARGATMRRMSDTPEVKLLKNGPIQIKSPVELVDHDGAKIAPEKFNTVRC
jgi:hypothetical protein